MITDIFTQRYPKTEFENLSDSFFVQLFNLYDDHHGGIKKLLLEKISGFPDSGYADEHIRIIDHSMKKMCTELGYKDLDKPEYKDPDFGFNNYRIFKNYIFDKTISPLEKLTLLELLFREAEAHLKAEIQFLQKHIPEYETRSEHIKNLSEKESINYYNDGQDRLDKALPTLDQKLKALKTINEEINQRLRQHQIPFEYHNGLFQKAGDEVIEEFVGQPFWRLLADTKYQTVQEEMQDAIDRLDTDKKDPALPAAKALESTLKIICKEKGLTNEMGKSANFYLQELNSKNNGSLISNEEKEELERLFKIRNNYGAHGAGTNKIPKLTHNQALRFINSAMVWIHSFSKR